MTGCVVDELLSCIGVQVAHKVSRFLMDRENLSGEGTVGVHAL